MASTDRCRGEGPDLVCLAGGDGSGKSTQIEAVREALIARGMDVRTASIWDGLTNPRVAPALPFAGRSAVHEYLGVLGPAARTHFLFHAMHVAMDCARADSPDLVLIDAYWYKYFATEVAQGGDPAVLRQWTRGFQRPHLTVYLRTSVDTAVRRKAVPSDYESGYGGPDAFRRLQATSRRVLDDLGAELGWVVVDGEGGEQRVTAAILGALNTFGDRP